MPSLPLALRPGWLPRGDNVKPWPIGKPPRDDPEKQRLIFLAYQRVLAKHPVQDEVDESLVDAWAGIAILEENPDIEADALEELVRCVKARAGGKWFIYELYHPGCTPDEVIMCCYPNLLPRLLAEKYRN